MVTALVCFDPFSQLGWVPLTFFVVALLGPLIAYIAALDDAPLLSQWPRVVRACVLTLSSIVATLVGYCTLYVAVNSMIGRHYLA
jgi:hypothetical protein